MHRLTSVVVTAFDAIDDSLPRLCCPECHPCGARACAGCPRAAQSSARGAGPPRSLRHQPRTWPAAGPRPSDVRSLSTVMHEHPPIVVAAGQGDLSTVRALLAEGIAVDSCGKWTEVEDRGFYKASCERDTDTALCAAVRGGHAEVVAALLAAGANPTYDVRATRAEPCSAREWLQVALSLNCCAFAQVCNQRKVFETPRSIAQSVRAAHPACAQLLLGPAFEEQRRKAEAAWTATRGAPSSLFELAARELLVCEATELVAIWDGSNAQRVIFWRPSGHVITRYVTAARSVIRRITLPRHSAAWQRTGEQGTPPPAAMAEEWAYALVVLAADKGKEPTCNSVRRGGGAFGARARWTTSSDVAAARYNAVMDSARLRHVITRYVFSAARSSHPRLPSCHSAPYTASGTSRRLASRRLWPACPTRCASAWRACGVARSSAPRHRQSLLRSASSSAPSTCAVKESRWMRLLMRAMTQTVPTQHCLASSDASERPPSGWWSMGARLLRAWATPAWLAPRLTQAARTQAGGDLLASGEHVSRVCV